MLSVISILASLAIGAPLAQTAEDPLKSTLMSIHYSPLAEQARIHGDVRLNLNSGLIEVVFGHPLLVATAVANAEALGSIQHQMNLEVTYHFVFADTVKSVPTVTTVKRGNAFHRAILGLFGRKTKKVIHGFRCEEGVAPANEVKVNGAIVEVWVYGRTYCIETLAVSDRR